MENYNLSEHVGYKFNPGTDCYEMDYDVWICPECKNTKKAPVFRTCEINTICECRYPDHVTDMTLIKTE